MCVRVCICLLVSLQFKDSTSLFAIEFTFLSIYYIYEIQKHERKEEKWERERESENVNQSQCVSHQKKIINGGDGTCAKMNEEERGKGA